MNILLLKAWLEENAGGLSGARLRDVRQVDAKSFAVQLGTSWLLASILEGYPTLAILEDGDPTLATNPTETGFVKALRFQLTGAALMSTAQTGFDRSVSFEFARKDIYGRETLRTLRVELVGRASNAYLLNEKGVVISIFKHVPAGRNSVRRVVTGRPLPPPPPLGKYVAAEHDPAELQREQDHVQADTRQQSMQEVLTRRVAGGDVALWPRLERLIDPDWDIEGLQQFILRLQAGEYTSQLFELSANAAALAEWRAARTMGAGTVRKGAEQRPVRDNRLAQLELQLAASKRAEDLEALGIEMLQRVTVLSNRELEASFLRGWQLAHPEWSERVDVSKSAEENAGALIEYAQRLKRARPRLESLLAEAPPVVGEAEVGSARKAQVDPLQRDMAKLERNGVKYLRYVTSDGMAIIVGQSDRSNDELVRHYGSSRHLWLHVRDYPGSHVLLLTNGRDVPQRSLEEAAIVAGYYSQGRGEVDLDVSYTPVKQLRRPKGGKPGQVLKLSERVLRVNPMRFEALRDSLRWAQPA